MIYSKYDYNITILYNTILYDIIILLTFWWYKNDKLRLPRQATEVGAELGNWETSPTMFN